MTQTTLTNTHSAEITYVGHATVLIEMGGVRLLTDPLLRNRVLHLRRQKIHVDPGVTKNLSAIMISHAHWDHLDLPSLRLFDRSTKILLPQGIAKILHKEGFQNITELKEGDQVSVGSIAVRATYADHDGARFRYGPAADTLGFVIEGKQRIYFAGDTDVFPGMSDLSEGLDIALLPVWGWGPTLGSGHMNPQQAASALQLLNPRIAIPIHWGTFFPWALNWLLPRFLNDPPWAFANFAAGVAPDVEVKIVAPGESTRI
jgi:L-ascorbate metabolism protein UlaG (beta-lactamase superfamily)